MNKLVRTRVCSGFGAMRRLWPQNLKNSAGPYPSLLFTLLSQSLFSESIQCLSVTRNQNVRSSLRTIESEHITLTGKVQGNLQGPCLVSQKHQLVRRLKATNSSVLKTFNLVKSCSKIAQKSKSCLKLLSSTEKSCSKRQKLLKSCRT